MLCYGYDNTNNLRQSPIFVSQLPGVHFYFWWLISLALIVESRPHNAYIPVFWGVFFPIRCLNPYFWLVKSVVFGWFQLRKKVGQSQLHHGTPCFFMARWRASCISCVKQSSTVRRRNFYDWRGWELGNRLGNQMFLLESSEILMFLLDRWPLIYTLWFFDIAMV